MKRKNQRSSSQDENRERLYDNGFVKVSKAILQHYGPDVAVFLSNLIEKRRMFAEQNKLVDGEWFYQTHQQQMDETGLTIWKLRNCKNRLVADEVIETKLMWRPAKEFYRINTETLVKRTRVRISNPLRVRNSDPYKGKETQRLIKKDLSKKEINSSSDELEEEEIFNFSNGWIVCSQFERFWRLYPKRAHKGKALSEWRRLCSIPPEQRPQWVDIKRALLKQKKTKQWQDKKYIPHPTTWLNQSRWLDDPNEMYVPKNGKEPEFIIDYGVKWFRGKDGQYRNDEGKLHM
jgi:hypothetical protein